MRALGGLNWVHANYLGRQTSDASRGFGEIPTWSLSIRKNARDRSLTHPKVALASRSGILKASRTLGINLDGHALVCHGEFPRLLWRPLHAEDDGYG
jgi:hypothetical protein